MKATPLLLLFAASLGCTGSLTGASSSDADGSTPSVPEVPAPTDAATGAMSLDARVDARTEPDSSSFSDAAIEDAATSAGSKLSLALFNVVRGQPLLSPPLLPSVLQRVELPPSVSVVADATSEIVAVRFFVDGVETRLDTQAPFVLNESSEGVASNWSLSAGMHQVEARGFADTPLCQRSCRLSRTA